MSEDFVNVATGQVVALRVAVSALFMAHPDKEALRTALQRILQGTPPPFAAFSPASQQAAEDVMADLWQLLTSQKG